MNSRGWGPCLRGGGLMAALAVGAAAVAFAPGECCAQPAAADPREAAVRELVDRYFRTWSAQDIDRYGQCFMPQAAIQLVDPDARLVTMPLRVFLQTQREAHRTSPAPMTETPESVEVRFEGKLARVIVDWKLVVGPKVTRGFDHFTLVQSGGQWRIANLIFYESDAGAQAGAAPESAGP
ncbi:MAG TPA: nuclear transport factor 2 family protein [Lacipirellulaceae bacterium]|nr:nuclear transport factor 2 family protein [Lacipirellulaceae bacterium]